MNHDRPDCLRITDGTWQTWLSRCRGKFSSLAASLAVLLLIISSQNAFGQGRSFDGFSDLITFEEPARPIDEPKPRPMWGPVETDKISLANQAPVLLPFFNNGMVFGLPGTVTGPLSERTQLTGDWGGWRTELAEKGLFIDVYSMSNYQQNTAGGLSNAGWFVQNIQWSLNLDTGRAGLWSGGLLHFTMQSRYGPSPQTTFNSGASVPVYTGLLLPDPAASSTTLPSEYFLVQALSQKTSFLVGKISDVFIPDQTLFGNAYKYYFSNFAFNKNPITTNFYNPTAWAALGIWAPRKNLAFAGGVLDPNSKAQNLANNAFDHVNLYLTAVASYQLAGLPGQFSPAFNWSNQYQIDLKQPFGQLHPSQIPQAVGALLGANNGNGLPVNYSNNSCFIIANASQYLYVVDSPEVAEKKLGTGQPLRGIGVFGRGGWAPDRTNNITADGSVALFARGLLDSRQWDSAGVGWYMNGMSSYLNHDIQALTGGYRSVSNEQGLEVFYDYAITPALRLIPSYQHIWNPLASQVVNGSNNTDLWMIRMTANF